MKPIFLNVAILFVLSIFVMACSGNSGTGSTCSSDEAQQMKVATSAGADVEDLVEDAMDEADDLVKEQESSIVGKIQTLLKRRLAAIRYVNEWMEKHQLENANDKDALEKNKDLLSKNDQAFKLLEEKYKKDYNAALVRFKKERARYVSELSNMDGLRVIPSQANYVMAEITTGMSAKELNRQLIVKYNILIKNLVAKLCSDGRQYIRLAVKTREENDRLIAALKELFSKTYFV